MPSFSVVRDANAKFAPSYLPVALFVGGTSGIGQATAESFARYTKGNAHIVIIGRNRNAAEAILSTFPTPTSPAAKHEFLSCDATLMRNVGQTCDDLNTRLTKINYLVLSPGMFAFKGRDETEEGIDKMLALSYYARWKFIDRLLPLLHKGKERGEDARVMSILGAGKGGSIDLHDLGLKEGYGLGAVTNAGATYNDAAVQEFASRHPDISFAHVYPGIVNTPILYFHWTVRLLTPLVKLLFTSPVDCSEFLLHSLTRPEYGRGAWFLNEKGESLPANKWTTEDVRKQIWQHTVEATTVTSEGSH